MDGSATSLNSSTLIDHQLHISFQKMEVIGGRQVLVHGPMIPITCGYNLDEGAHNCIIDVGNTTCNLLHF